MTDKLASATGKSWNLWDGQSISTDLDYRRLPEEIDAEAYRKAFAPTLCASLF